MRIFKQLLYISACLVFCASVSAQDPYCININKIDGLPSNSIYDIFQDSKGFIWISSNEGLTRYDGFEFKTYTNNKQTSLSGNSIEEDKYGRIWYQNFDGYLYYVEHDSLKSLKQNTTVGRTGYGIVNDKLFTLQANGIDIFDIRTLKVVKTVPVDLSLFASVLHYKDNFYLLLGNKLLTLSEQGLEKETTVIEGGTLVGSKQGVRLVNRKRYSNDPYEIVDISGKKLAATTIYYMHGSEYCDELYWLFTPNGVFVYNDAGLNINNGQPFFPAKSISSVLKDREGNYWLGTLDNGILFMPDLKTKLISNESISPNLLLVTDNQLYIGTKENAVYTFDISKNIFENKYKGNVRHEILLMMSDPRNNLFFISAERFIVAKDNFKDLTQDMNAVKEVVPVDLKYCAVAATGINGLYKMRDDITSTWDSLFDASFSNPDNKKFCRILEPSRGRTIAYNPVSGAIYTGTNRGLFLTTPKGSSEIKLNNQSIYARKLVNYGSKVYLLSPQNSLYAITAQNTVTTIRQAEGNDQPLNLRKVGNSLYLLTSNGIRVLDTITGTFNLISMNPAIRSEEINDIAIVNDKFVIASDRGLILLDSSTHTSDIVAPGFIVNKILVNGDLLQRDQLTHLSHTSNDIDIFYSILAFGVENKFRLYYKINGGNWQLASNATRNLKLASLSPGSYEISFQLRSQSGNVFAQQPVQFTISKPFWIQWWFWGACFALLAVGGYAYYKWQTRLLKKKNALVLEKVELEKNLRSSMLTSIRAQMNPHFFYNALNTIQSFIFSDDKRNASTYLVKLSRLTRMILEMSEKESVSLDEEMDALKLYLELEKMRFSDDFNYEIRVGKEVDSELVKIPSMIVQPYVENAVKHGLLHKNGNKLLSIEFAKLNGNLCVTIDDNGVGREKANELNQVKKEKHHPFSTDANSKRIELLNKERSKSIGIVYVDKIDENGEPSGTTVIISVPLT